MTEIVFFVPGEITPWARTRMSKGGFRFTPSKQRNYMAVLKDFAQRAMNGRPLIEGPIKLDVEAQYQWPKSWSAKKKSAPGAEYKISRPDIDNCAVKAVMDSLNGIVWRDDSQVALVTAKKIYSDKPMLTVVICTVTTELHRP